MMGVKWAGGVALAYMALAYIRDALPRDVATHLDGPGVRAAGVIALEFGFVLAGVHVAAERRRSPIARWSRPAKLASIAPAVAGAFIVLTWWQHPSDAGADDRASSAPAIRWESSEPAALRRAAAEHKPLLVDFGVSWCGACTELEEKTFPDPRVCAEGARFIALRVDATNDDDPEVMRLRRKYGALEGLPVVLLFGSDGKEAVRFTEFVRADRLAQVLASVR